MDTARFERLLAELEIVDPSYRTARGRVLGYTPRELSFFDGVTGGVCVPDRCESVIIERFARLGVRHRIDRGHEAAHRFVAMARRPSCPECGVGLRYLFGDRGNDNLGCEGCGGMFDFAGFFAVPVVHLWSTTPYLEPDMVCCDPLLGPFGLGRKPRGNHVVFRGAKNYESLISLRQGVVCARDFDPGWSWAPLSSGDRVHGMRVEILDRG